MLPDHLRATEAFVSYNAADFDATCRFYEAVLGCRRVTGWDRSDGRGAYYAAGAAPLAEILGAAHGEPPLTPPVADSFTIVLMVSDASEAKAEITRRGGSIALPMAERPYGRFFGVRDPNGVLIYLMQRTFSPEP